jgi:hypothetical protein
MKPIRKLVRTTKEVCNEPDKEEFNQITNEIVKNKREVCNIKAKETLLCNR